MSTRVQRAVEGLSKNRNKLTEREQFIVERYYGLTGELRWTLQELGNRYDLTRERIRQIKKDAFMKMGVDY